MLRSIGCWAILGEVKSHRSQAFSQCNSRNITLNTLQIGTGARQVGRCCRQWGQTPTAPQGAQCKAAAAWHSAQQSQEQTSKLSGLCSQWCALSWCAPLKINNHFYGMSITFSIISSCQKRNEVLKITQGSLPISLLYLALHHRYYICWSTFIVPHGFEPAKTLSFQELSLIMVAYQQLSAFQANLSYLMKLKLQWLISLLQKVTFAFCFADLPAADQLKAAFSQVIRYQQDRLSKTNTELQQIQGSANIAQGALDACLADLTSQRQEATALQEQLNSRLLEIESQVC